MSKSNQSNMRQNTANEVIELGVASVETQGILDGEETLGGEAPAGISEE